MVTGTGQQIDLETGEAGLHSTPLVVKDVVIVGSSFKEGMTVVTHNNTKGLVRAFDVRTGKLLWTFNTIPRPGEFGNDTWENGSWATNGNTGVWTQMTVDEDLGLVYLPVESPTSDFYGGERPGDNLFGESLVCVDLKTGKRKWHFQVVHHPDLGLRSFLRADPGRHQCRRQSDQSRGAAEQGSLPVCVRSRDRQAGLADRRAAVPQSDVPGEKTSPTQPFPTKPPAYARNFIKIPDDLIDFTPELRAQAKDAVARYQDRTDVHCRRWSAMPKAMLGALNLGNASGGTNWPGAGYDPETHIVYAQAASVGAVSPISLRTPPAGFSDIRYVLGRNDTAVPRRGRTRVSAARPMLRSPSRPRRLRQQPQLPGGAAASVAALTVQGLSIVKPPYGVISAINLDRGELQWQVPYGETPDAVRNHPGAEGNEHSEHRPARQRRAAGHQDAGDPGRQPGHHDAAHPRGAMLRAYDKATGKEVGAVWMPAPQSGSPMTYMVDGKQYIVVAVSGGAYSGEYIAYALPREE